MNALNIVQPDIKTWSDLWFSRDKKAGFVALANNKYHNIGFYGHNDYKNLINRTDGVKDRYISLNAFEVNDWNNTSQTRRSSNLKQIRTIGVDIDQYNKGLTIDEALDELQSLIAFGDIPEPNLVLTSNGIQIFYSIKGGLSPYRSGTSAYITEQLINRLKHIGADGNAKDVARLMRVPNSINSRNGKRVTADIWNDHSYTHHDLRKYVPKRAPNEIVRKSTVISIGKVSSFMNRTNQLRVNDFNKLIKLRNYDLTGKRNTMLYNYAFHTSLIDRNISEVLNKTMNIFSKVTSSDSNTDIFDSTEIQNTTMSAFDDANTFVNWYLDNNGVIVYGKNDGIIKPKTTVTLLNELEITLEEQQHMRTLVNAELARKNKNRDDRVRIAKERRKQGVRTLSEYEESRKTKRQKQLEELSSLMKEHPDYTQKQYADLIGVTRRTIGRWIKQLKD